MRAVTPRRTGSTQGQAWPWRRAAAVVLPVLGVVWLLQGAWMIHKAAQPHHDVLIHEGTCHTPATVLEPLSPAAPELSGESVPPSNGSISTGANGAPDTAIVIHGLAANRRLMMYLSDYLAAAGWRVYVLDLPGHGANADPFTFASAAECATLTVEQLVRRGQIDPARTVLVGHSMGGSIVVRMADRVPVAATIAISPGPVQRPRRMPSNLLVFSAQFDPIPLRREAGDLAGAAGGERAGPDDFVQKRAFELRVVPHATHTSVLHDPEVIEESVRWITASFHADAPQQKQAMALSAYWEQVRENPPTRNLLGSISGALGMLALFPFVATLAAATFGALCGKDAEPDSSVDGSSAAPGVRLLLAEGAACGLAAAVLLKLGVPLRFLHLYEADYLVSLLFIASVLLLALNWRRAQQEIERARTYETRAIAAGALLGFVTFLGVSAWFNWQITDLWLEGPRWLRFAALLPFACVFSFAEELLLGPVRTGWRRAGRYAVALVLRVEFWGAIALTYYTLGNGQILLLLLVVYFAAFSVFQRLGADALRRRTGSAAAAALFNAILAGWFIAAVFPLA